MATVLLFNKYTLEELSRVSIDLKDTTSFTVDQMSCAIKSGNCDIPFTLTAVNKSSPNIESIEYGNVVRVKVDLNNDLPVGFKRLL